MTKRKDDIKTTKTERFNLSGPIHLTSIDWENAHHKRSVAASLVQGVYVMELDRQLKREGSQALALPWWEFFHFQLLSQLVDNVGSSIFGAIYEYKPPTSHQNISVHKSPSFIIAFRGTLPKRDTLARDFILDLDIIRNKLHRTSRLRIGTQAVQDMVDRVGDSNVCITGHSLGAAMGILAGKTMAKTGVFLESFIFNPPFVSPPIERMKCKKIKQGLQIASSYVTAGLAHALKGKQQKDPCEDLFLEFSAWIPSLYVNPRDHVCSAYIGYFEKRKTMEDIGAEYIEKIATQNSFRGLLKCAMGRDGKEPQHLIPSANLTKNLSHSKHFIKAHSLQQWWKPDQNLDSVLYEYK